MFAAIQRRHLLCLILALLPSSTAQAEIYKSVNNGIVSYSAEKPHSGAFERLKPTCLLSYIGCEQANRDWSLVKLNRHAFRTLIEESASIHGVDANLIRAVIHAESAFNPRARSKAGAEGLMQLMPTTQKLLRVSNPYNAKENIDAGTRLLKQFLMKFSNNIKHAVAAYNAGEESVARHRGVPPYEETRSYVKRVAQLYSRYRQR